MAALACQGCAVPVSETGKATLDDARARGWLAYETETHGGEKLDVLLCPDCRPTSTAPELGTVAHRYPMTKVDGMETVFIPDEGEAWWNE